MSQINFGSFVDMLTIATPSSGYIVAYDLDGILKQKDFFGTVIEIGGGPTSGSTASSLAASLSQGNNSGVYSIIMGTSTSIRSANGGGSLNLDNMGASAVSLSTDNGALAETYLLLKPDSFRLNYKYSTSQTLLQAGTAGEFLINSPERLTLHVNSVDFLTSNIGTVSTVDTAKYSTIISSRNSTVNDGIRNSVILGGQGLTASTNDTVYVSSLNVNNAYTLPSTDGTNGYVLRTDGSGNVSWQAFASSATTLAQALAVGNTSSGYDIVLSDGDVIISPNLNSYLDFDSGNKLYAVFNNSFFGGYLDINSSQNKLDFRSITTGAGGYLDITTSGLELSHTSSVSAVAGSFVLGKSSQNSTPLVFQNSSNGNSVTIQSGVTIGNYTITLPNTQGVPNSFLRNDGTGNLTWTIPAATLYDTLQIGNTTSTDILLANGHAIKSLVTTPYAAELLLTGGSNAVFLINNSNLLDKSWIFGDADDLQIGYNDNYFFASDSKIELVSFTGSVIAKLTADGINNRISMGVQHIGTTFSSNQDSIQVLSTWTGDINSNSNEKFPSVLSSVNATFSQFVINTVVLGGRNIQATASDTVYLGNSVNINNAYTLPNIDGTNGYVLKTDGSGNVNWMPESSAVTYSLAEILSAGNTTGTYSINVENTISFEATGTSQSISGFSINSPAPGFWYYLPGDATSAIYAGSEVILTNTFGGVNNGTKTILTSQFSGGFTYFTWTGIITTIGSPFGNIRYAIQKGYLGLSAASQSNYYTLPNKSGTIALLSDITGGGGGGSASISVVDYNTGITYSSVSTVIFRGGVVNVPTGTASAVSVSGPAPTVTIWIPAANYVGYFTPTLGSGTSRYVSQPTTNSYNSSLNPGQFGIGTWTPSTNFVANTTRSTINSSSSFTAFTETEFACFNTGTTMSFTLYNHDGSVLSSINNYVLNGAGSTTSNGITITVNSFLADSDRYKANVSGTIAIGTLFPNGGRFNWNVTHHNGEGAGNAGVGIYSYTSSDLFYDNDGSSSSSSISSGVDFDELSPITVTYSGVSFYKVGAQFALTASGINLLNDMTFPTTKQIDFSFTNMAISGTLDGYADGSKGAGSAITGWTIDWNSSSLTYSRTGTVNSASTYVPGYSSGNSISTSPVSYIRGTIYDWSTVGFSQSVSRSMLFDTYTPSSVTFNNNPLDSETGRLSVSGVLTSGSAAFDSTLSLTSSNVDELQYIFGRVIYPQANFTSFYPTPNWSANVDYSSLDGSNKSFVVYTDITIGSTTSVSFNDYRWHVTSYGKDAAYTTSFSNGIFVINSNFTESVLDYDGVNSVAGSGDLVILVGIDDTSSNTTPNKFLFVSGDPVTYGTRQAPVTYNLNKSASSKDIQWSKGTLSPVVRKVWLFIGYKNTATGKTLNMTNISFS